MPAKITKDVLESYLNCKYKGYLKLTGQQGTKSDYETLLTEMRAAVRLAAIDKILASRPGEEIPRNIPLTTSALKQGASFLLDATLDDDLVSITFDGLKRVDGQSKLGAFHYVPMIFYEENKIKRTQRALLEIQSLLLSKVQEKVPAYGVVVHGNGCKATRVRMKFDIRKAERIIHNLKEMSSTQSPPSLILNDHCQVCEFRQRCHEQAVKEDNISLLRGVKEKEVKGYAKKGILTVTQLAHTFRPRRKRKRAREANNRHHHALQALAIRDKKIYVFGTPELPTHHVQIYLDIEGKSDESFEYLIGMIVVTRDSETRYSFWAEDKDQELAIFEQFLNEATRHEEFVVYCYGSYEKDFLKRMRKQTNRKNLVDKVLKNTVNVLSVVYSHVYFPCHSNGLKYIAACLGCSWTEPQASGLQSIVWRTKWETTRSVEWKQKLLEYNIQDCTALMAIAKCICGLCAPLPAAVAAGGSIPEIAQANDIHFPPSSNQRFRKNELIPDFDYVNRRAFFDYQREKIYIRTNADLMRLAKARSRRQKAKKIRHPSRSISKQIDCCCKKCPHCKSTNIRRCKRAKFSSKYHVHLTFRKSGVCRRITKYKSQQYRCLDCERRFLPPSFKKRTRRDKYSHAFKSWVAYLHLKHRMSFNGIHDVISELFGIKIYHAELYSFQSYLSNYYKPTYEQILASITTGPLAHADETSAKLREDGGYVWVLASMREVAYMYNKSREGEFIQGVLSDFRGVLVSDFYTAYDSINCSRQKCLVHLIRDLNDDLLSHPYDDEFKDLVYKFAHLLRTIISTVDNYGLKRIHLIKHEQDAVRFFEALSIQQFASDVATSYKKRFLKYRNEMFTFLKHDGVPWNNNNAEHAVKSFAQYREISEGVMTEDGLKDYLIMLSIQQTCRYRGISFLRFLLSGEKDIDLYCVTRQQNGADVAASTTS